MQKKRRGRPRGACADFQTDRDALAVILLDAQMRFASLKPGIRPRERQAAMFAVLACSDPSRVTDPTQYPGAPPHGLASSGHRMAPLKKSLRNGYDEIEIETVVEKELRGLQSALRRAGYSGRAASP